MGCICDNPNPEASSNGCEEACPTNCANQIFVNSCGCNTACGCNNAGAINPTPYYNAAEACQESHSRVCINSQYVTGVSISNSFNMPACGQTAVLIIPGLQLINIGVYLWHPTYGYLKVVDFDFANSTVFVENECQDNNVAPGTAIPACTTFTVTDTPITQVSPCPDIAVSSGILSVCNANGDGPFALNASSVGQVPVVIDADTNEVEFQTLDIEAKVCTVLTADLTLLIGNAGPYTITVSDTSEFTTGDLIQIGTRTDRFTVVLVLSPTQFTATVDPAPAAGEVIQDGVAVCLAQCCEQITKRIDDYIDDPCSWDLSDRFRITTYEANGAVLPYSGTLAPAASVQVGSIDLLVRNSSCGTMLYDLDIDFYATFSDAPATAGQYAFVELIPQFAWDDGLIGTVLVPTPIDIATVYDFFNYGTANGPRTMHYHYSLHRMIDAGDELRAAARIKLYYPSGTVSPMNYANTYINISGGGIGI